MEIGIGLGITRFPGWGVMNIGQLFASGEQGAWYDPSDMSTLFQDSAGTVPVTAVEQPVGRILDKSGRGNHASQATTTKRPVLKIDAGGRYYLSFDGVDDALQTGNIDFTGTDKMTVWAGVTKLSITDIQAIAELSNTFANNSTFLLYAYDGAATIKYEFGSRGTSAALAATTDSKYNAPTSNVVTGIGHILGDMCSLRVDGLQVGQSTTDQGTVNYGNYPLYIGARAATSNLFNGRLYGLIVRGAQSSLSQIEATELYMKKKVGIA